MVNLGVDSLESMVSQGNEMITTMSTYEEIRKALVKNWGEKTVETVEVDLKKCISVD